LEVVQDWIFICVCTRVKKHLNARLVFDILTNLDLWRRTLFVATLLLTKSHSCARYAASRLGNAEEKHT
jgi:hypothetical protein